MNRNQISENLFLAGNLLATLSLLLTGLARILQEVNQQRLPRDPGKQKENIFEY